MILLLASAIEFGENFVELVQNLLERIDEINSSRLRRRNPALDTRQGLRKRRATVWDGSFAVRRNKVDSGLVGFAM